MSATKNQPGKESKKTPIGIYFAYIGLFSFLGAYLYYAVIANLYARDHAPEGVKIFRLKDYWVTGVSTMVYLVLFPIWKATFYDFFHSIAKVQDDKVK